MFDPYIQVCLKNSFVTERQYVQCYEEICLRGICRQRIPDQPTLPRILTRTFALRLNKIIRRSEIYPATTSHVSPAVRDLHCSSVFRDMISQKTVCLFVLRFHGSVNPMESCRARSVYLTTRLLGRLSPQSG